MPRPRDPNAPPRRRRRARAEVAPVATHEVLLSIPEPVIPVPPASNTEHARLSPSASGRWLNCPSSIVLHEQLRAQPGYVEPPDGEAAIYGRRLHETAEAFLRGDPDAGEGMTAADMRLVEPYVEHVRGLMDLMPEAVLIIEERLYTLVDDCWGTCDCAIWHAPTNELWVIDLKTGHGRVAAVENTQLGIYALGVETRFTPHDVTFNMSTVVHLQIVQPRDEDEPIKSWTTSRAWLTDLANRMLHASNDLLDITNGIADPEPRLGDHCQYCPAAPNCPAMRDRTLTVFDSRAETSPERGLVPAMNDGVRMNAQPRDVSRLEPEQIAFFLRHSDVITAFLDACRQRAMSEDVPGFKVVEARTRRRWQDEEAVITDLIAAGREDLLRRLPPTIGEAERALGRGHAIVRTYAVAPAGVPTVVPESDARPALDRNRVFRVEGSDGVASSA